MRHVLKLSAVTIAAGLALAGCASLTKPNSPRSFEPSVSQGMNAVEVGTILSVHNVHIVSSDTGIATGAGALGGAAVGDKLGGTLGAVLGAVAGGVGGHMVESRAGKQQAQQLTIELAGLNGKPGNLVSVTQATGPRFVVGERVELIIGAKVCGFNGCTTQPTRVMPLASN